MKRIFYWGIAILIILLIAGTAYLIVPKHNTAETLNEPQTAQTAGRH